MSSSLSYCPPIVTVTALLSESEPRQHAVTRLSLLIYLFIHINREHHNFPTLSEHLPKIFTRYLIMKVGNTLKRGNRIHQTNLPLCVTETQKHNICIYFRAFVFILVSNFVPVMHHLSVLHALVSRPPPSLHHL